MVAHGLESDRYSAHTLHQAEDLFGSGGQGMVLGVLLTGLDSEEEFAAGVVDWAKARDVTVVLFAGGYLHARTSRNAIFRLASERWLDGLIISPFLRHLVSVEAMTQFCERYAPLPIVMAASGLEAVPHVRVDSFSGMRDVVSHLIETHHLERIAFVTGPEDDAEAEERYQAYETALRDHDLVVDPGLVVAGDFTPASGSRAMRKLLDAQVEFDAVVGANDATAAGIYSILRDHGMSVPGDVALAGFDDSPELRASLSLTTARQSFYELAYQVGDRLLELVQGRSIPNKTLVPASLVVRGSCGCVSDQVAQAAIERSTLVEDSAREDPLDERYRPQDVPVEIWRAFAQDVREAGSMQPPDSDESSPEPASSLTFLRTWERYLQEAHQSPDSIRGGPQVLNALRRSVVPFLDTMDAVIRVENLIQQARVLGEEAAERLADAALRGFQAQASLLRTFDVELSSAQDLEGLAPVIQSTLAQLGIHQCYLVRWTGGAQEQARLALAVNQQRVERVDRDFSVEAGLLPEGSVGAPSDKALVVLPLTVEDDVLGYAMVNWGPRDGTVYQRIESQFSSVFYRLRLLEEANVARRQAEQTLEKVINTRAIVDHLQQAVDTEAVLRITLEELSEVLHAPQAVARLGTREQLLENQDSVDG
jgi:DNA-binding LacI/PurR family transcriptional regulator